MAILDALNKWQMFYLSQSLTRARRLEKQREDYYEEIYNTITYSAMRLDESLEGIQSHATDAQAIRLIEMQERHDRRIRREYARYVRWQGILEWVDENERIILIRYFQKKKHVQPKIIRRILDRIDKRLQAQEKQIEKELDAKAQERFNKLDKHNNKNKVVQQAAEDEGKRRYLINGEFILMTGEEYAERMNVVKIGWNSMRKDTPPT